MSEVNFQASFVPSRKKLALEFVIFSRGAVPEHLCCRDFQVMNSSESKAETAPIIADNFRIRADQPRISLRRQPELGLKQRLRPWQHFEMKEIFTLR